ncbi:MAG: hypothetical protein IJ820_08155, partial [Lachnospiraceae bacterium]|nr:hypothetical protein [Lachnospiraceae bacterium]
MSTNIITGYTGERHITPAMDAAIFRAVFGNDSYILSEGDMLQGSMPDNNRFVVAGGIVSMQGHQIQVKQETLAVDTCASANKRIDLVVVRYTHDAASQVDAAELLLLKGSEVSSSNDPTEPAYNTGTIDEGATVVDMPLYRIDLAGASVEFTLVAPRIDVNLFEILIPDGAASHNAVYRGKFLGSEVTEEQFEEISSGRFHDLFIGDYWTINGFTWRIADFDYWYGMGDTACETHHAVIVPDEILYSGQMNTSNVTTGGYYGSAMYKTGLNSAKTTINSAFGSAHVLKHRDLLTNAVTNGYASAGAWYDSTVELMTEEMVYGSIEFKNITNGTAIPYSYTIGQSQLKLFQYDHSRICNRSHWWLRDVVSAAYFARVNSGGNATNDGASGTYG